LTGKLINKLGGTAETCPELVEGELFVPVVDEEFLFSLAISHLVRR